MKAYLFFAIFIIAYAGSQASHLKITNTALAEKSIENGCAKIQFDIAWDGSWRASTTTGNWDAAWLFVKFQKKSDMKWYHATINTSTENSYAGSSSKHAMINIPARGSGAFIFRSKDGNGPFASDGVRLQWDYYRDSLSDSFEDEIIQVKVFGIEMVYIPEAPFWAGGIGNENNTFFKFGAEKQPYQICSEKIIKLGNKDGRLTWQPGNASGVADGTVPAAFPKGYDAFYLMKYEINQGQYADFLNTLTEQQLKYRYHNRDFRLGYFVRNVAGVFGCDANQNDTLNEASDGQEIACNSLSWADGAAFADWSGLSPMTELEFEKACRGPLQPVANEFAWGSANIVRASLAVNPYTAKETCKVGNCNYHEGNEENERPLRNGVFELPQAAREAAGKGYYGNCELSGNLWERVISIGNPSGRNFNGSNGNGMLNENGYADVPSWPGTDANGTGFRGGSWNASMHLAMTSDRYSAANEMAKMNGAFGFRCCFRPRK